MRLLGALIAGIFTGIAISFVAPTLNWGFAVNAAAPANGGPQWVDRTRKGDRLDIPDMRIGKQPAPVHKILVGCEPTTSPLSSRPVAIPGRCTA